jgi:hypothetical protein
MRAALMSVWVGLASLAVGCANPECPEGRQKIGKVCVRVGRGDAGDTSTLLIEAGTDRNEAGPDDEPWQLGEVPLAGDASRVEVPLTGEAAPVADLVDAARDDASNSTAPSSAPDAGTRNSLDSSSVGQAMAPPPAAEAEAPTQPEPAPPAPVIDAGTAPAPMPTPSTPASNTHGAPPSPPLCFIDADGDGFGSKTTTACLAQGGTGVDNDKDCDDRDAKKSPVQSEVCTDGIDNNCDGKVDPPDAASALTWYQDCDGDGYAAASEGSVKSCAAPAPQPDCKAWVSRAPSTQAARDCDDTSSAYRPGAPFGLPTETNNSSDLDCDGAVEPEDAFTNADGTKLPICKQNETVCDCWIPYAGDENVLPMAVLSAWGNWFFQEKSVPPPPAVPCTRMASDIFMTTKLMPMANSERGCTFSRENPAGVVDMTSQVLCR